MTRIFLIGYMGAGKTTLGKAFAREMSLNFIDLDWFIEERFHKPFNSCSWNAEKTDSGNWNGKCCTKWPSLKMWLFRPVEEHLVFLITWSI